MQLEKWKVLHLDTHVVCWLYAGVVHLLSDSASEYLERNELRVSPAVLFELQSLREQGILLVDPSEILADLERRIGLCIDKIDATSLVVAAASHAWAKDPYDRLIVAHAKLAEAPLLTKDAAIHANFPQAVW